MLLLELLEIKNIVNKFLAMEKLIRLVVLIIFGGVSMMINFNVGATGPCQMYDQQQNRVEYLYPVASCAINQKEYGLLLHQQGPTKTSVLLWNPETRKLQSILWSLYCPAGIRVFPDNSGFSFVDRGRIYIKRWNDRTPKALDIFEPIYNIEYNEWINSDICYFHALRDQRFGIYAVNRSGDSICLACRDDADCMYPQIVGNQLFYIQREKRKGCCCTHIKSVQIPDLAALFINLSNQENRLNCYVNVDEAQTIAVEHEMPLIFLTMISSQEGYVIGYSRDISEDQQFVEFLVCYITQNLSNWCYKALFSFSLPIELLFGTSEKRLFESIVPFLPRKIGNDFYYVTSKYQSGQLEYLLNQYNLECNNDAKQVHFIYKTTSPITVPLKIRDNIVFGRMCFDGNELPIAIDHSHQKAT